jgi:hypothetical protein
LISICISHSSLASIINGDFNNRFGSWTFDTDGFGSPQLGLNDFSIAQHADNNNAARLEIDYYKSSGDINSQPRDEAIFANTLYQSLNLTIADNQRWGLSFDWQFNGEASLFDENFVVGLGDSNGNYFNQDHNLGFLLNPTSYGSGHFETLLDSRFNNSTGWNLEFQLNSGLDGYGSYINIDNVALVMQPSPTIIPLPGALWLFVSSLITLVGIKSYLNK